MIAIGDVLIEIMNTYHCNAFGAFLILQEEMKNGIPNDESNVRKQSLSNSTK